MITSLICRSRLVTTLARFTAPERKTRFFSTKATVAATNTAAVAAAAASFDLPRIREEILNNWLQAEARNGVGKQEQMIRSRYCCFTYHDASMEYKKTSANWFWLDKELSSNVAGETGAVYIYKGALAAMKYRSFPTDAEEFAKEHMINEAAHLSLFEHIVPHGKRTSLLPVWRVAGWALGFVPTILGGSKALYVTVQAVETFVEEHYQDQIIPLKKEGMSNELVRLLEHCCADEVHHKEDAAAKLLGPDEKEFDAWWVKPWTVIVSTGSSIAADIARRI